MLISGYGRTRPWGRVTSGTPSGATTLLEHVEDIIGTNEGFILDVASAFNRNAIWEDTARTILASVDGPVGSIQDELQRYYAEQATTAAKSLLRSGHWLEFDGVDDELDFGDILQFGLTSFTVVAAFRPNSVADSVAHRILSRRAAGGTTGTSPGWEFGHFNNGLVVQMDAGVNVGSAGRTLVTGALTVGWNIASASIDRSADIAVGRVNGVSGSAVDISAFGDITGTSPLTLGGQPAPSSLFPFAGDIGPVCVIGKLLSAGELNVVERWAASAVGVAL